MNSNASDILFGDLIGLCRVTDGNEHLISPSVTALILNCLKVLGDKTTGRDELARMSEQISNEKRKLVPDCFLCASPCGKNDAYNLESLLLEPENTQILKRNLMQRLIYFSSRRSSHEALESGMEQALYKAIIILGIDGVSEEDLSFYMNQFNI